MLLFFIWRLCHSHYASEACHILKLFSNFNMMTFGIPKQFVAKTVHMRVKILWFSDLGHVFRTRQCSTRKLFFFLTCVYPYVEIFLCNYAKWSGISHYFAPRRFQEGKRTVLKICKHMFSQ